jgi:hypothetical protein
MPKYAIHNADGDINRILDVPEEFIAQQLQDGELYVEVPNDADTHHAIDVATGELIRREKALPPKSPERPKWVQARAKLYPTPAETFDLIWHDIDKFGALTKDGSFYQRLKAVKEAVPVGAEVDSTVLYFMETLPQLAPTDAQTPQTPMPSDERAKYINELAYVKRKEVA